MIHNFEEKFGSSKEVMFAMGEEGSLPKIFAKQHSKTKSHENRITVQHTSPPPRRREAA